MVMSSEAGPETRFLHLNEGSNFKGGSESGMVAWDEPSPFVEFASGKSYVYCSLSQGHQWMFIRLEGRRATIDFEILTDSFRIIWGLYNQYKIKPAAETAKPAKEKAVAVPADAKELFATLGQVSSDLDKLIAEYSSSNGPNDMKELISWLGVIQKSAAEGSKKIDIPAKPASNENAGPVDLNNLIEKALTQIYREKGNGFDIVYQREGKFPNPEISQDAIHKSILEFFAAALYKREFSGALKLVAKGEDKSIVLELAGEQLSAAPKTGEKPAWLQEIGGRIEYNKMQNEQGQAIDTWRMIIPFENSDDKRPEAKPGPLKVLAVDSQEVIRELLTSMLTSLGYESTVVESSDEALILFKSHIDGGNPYALVIADYALDKITGLEFAREIKALDPDIFFLLISGWGLEPDPELARNMGIDSILKKPFRMEQLAEIIGIARKETAQS
jgi:CheY-like chemotaxis protein